MHEPHREGGMALKEMQARIARQYPRLMAKGSLPRLETFELLHGWIGIGLDTRCYEHP